MFSRIDGFTEKQRFHEAATVGKFQNFSISQILREINFRESRSAKTVILTHLHIGSEF